MKSTDKLVDKAMLRWPYADRQVVISAVEEYHPSQTVMRIAKASHVEVIRKRERP